MLTIDPMIKTETIYKKPLTGHQKIEQLSILEKCTQNPFLQTLKENPFLKKLPRDHLPDQCTTRTVHHHRTTLNPTYTHSRGIMRTLLLMILFTNAAWAQCPAFHPDNTPPMISNPKLTQDTLLLCNEAYGVLFSTKTRAPVWVAEHLTRHTLDLAAQHRERVNNFHLDHRVDPTQQPNTNQFNRTGYDRGHMAPFADMPNPNAQNESFRMTNMVAQEADNNRFLWSSIESRVRNIAKKRGELFILTGPIFIGEKVGSLGGVLVPTHLFKAIFDPKNGEAAVFITENAKTQAYQTLSLDEFETYSGLRVFPTLQGKARQHTMIIEPIQPRKKNAPETPMTWIERIKEKIKEWIS